MCKEAKEYHFASVCVNPCNVALVKKELAGSDVMTCSVIGFPFGTQTTEVKCAETEQALKDGADEIDMVINIGKLLEGNTGYVEKEIAALASICHAKKAHLKVIVETFYLSALRLNKPELILLKRLPVTVHAGQRLRILHYLKNTSKKIQRLRRPAVSAAARMPLNI